METVQHTKEMLLNSYNRQCRDCLESARSVSVQTALDWLVAEAVAAKRTGGTLRLANAIAIYQRAAKNRKSGQRKGGE